MESKNLFLSRVFWDNVIGLLAMFLDRFGVEVPVSDQELIVGAVLAIANIILRILTKQPVHVAKPGPGTTLVIVLILLSPLVLAGCTSMTPEENKLNMQKSVLFACSRFNDLVIELAYQPLNPSQVNTVGELIEVARPICTGPLPSSEMDLHTALSRMTQALNSLRDVSEER